METIFTEAHAAFMSIKEKTSGARDMLCGGREAKMLAV